MLLECTALMKSKHRSSDLPVLKPWPATSVPGGTLRLYWVEVCGPAFKTLALFMTKIYDFPNPIYDLKK